jgi:stromal membrane-associated protein
LPDNYVPEDSKIANFIRTKYDLKRWVMPGGIPDPASLGEAEPAQNDSTPLSEVQKRLSTKESVQGSSGQSRPVAKKPAAATKLIPDLLGDSIVATARPTVQANTASVSSTTHFSSTAPLNNAVAVAAAAAPQAKYDSLLGLDFAGRPPSTGSGSSAPPPPPPPKTDSLLGLDFAATQTAPATTAAKPPSKPSPDTSRPDLKKSILSLYAPAQQQSPTFPQNFPQPMAQKEGQPMGQPMAQPMGQPMGQPHTSPRMGGNFGGFESLTAQIGNVTLGQDPRRQSSTSSNGNVFENLIPGGGSSEWASTPSTNVHNVRKPSHDDEWASFSSAPPKPSGGEDDLFRNVWS